MSERTPLFVVVGRDRGEVLAAMMQNVSLLSLPTPTVICTDSSDVGLSLCIAQTLKKQLLAGEELADDLIRIAAPDNIARRLRPFNREYRSVPTFHAGAALSHVRMRSDITAGHSLIGIGSISAPINPETRESGPLAIGLWTRFAGSRVSLPLLHPIRREPRTADVALTIHRSIRVQWIIQETKGYVISVGSTDLVGIELGALAIQRRQLAGDEGKVGLWEDPVVQRATELDLGVESPSQIDLCPVLAMTTPTTGDQTYIAELVSNVSTLLNLP